MKKLMYFLSKKIELNIFISLFLRHEKEYERKK